MTLSSLALRAALLVAAALCLALVASAGPTPPDVSRELVHAIRCPVCDYTVSYMTKAALAAQRCTAADCPAPSAAIAATVKDACTRHVFKAFPAGMSAATRQHTPGRSDEERLASLEEYAAEPADEAYRAAIRHACEADMGPAQAAAVGAVLAEVTAGSAGEEAIGSATPEGQLYALRRRDYARVLAAQQRVCGRACGDIQRPEVPGPNPSGRTMAERSSSEEPEYLGRVSWNADGELIRRDHI